MHTQKSPSTVATVSSCVCVQAKARLGLLALGRLVALFLWGFSRCFFALFGVRWCCRWLGGFSWLFPCFSCAWCVFAFCFSCCVWLSRSRGRAFLACFCVWRVGDRVKRKSLKNRLLNGLLCFRPVRCVASSEKTKEKRQAVKPAAIVYISIFAKFSNSAVMFSGSFAYRSSHF